MESKKNIKGLVIIALLLMILGIIATCLNIGQINVKFADLKTKVEEDETSEETKILDTETIASIYTTKRESASEEVISRYNKTREVEHYNSIEEIKISKTMDLTQRCNVSRDDFILLISGVKADTSGFFEENAGMIYDLCEKYSINEIFFCGLISAESGWNIAGNHRRTHNYISLMSSNGLIQFNSVEDGLEKAASTLHNNYLTEGARFYCGKTLESVRTRFCPVNPGWTDLVYGRMQQII